MGKQMVAASAGTKQTAGARNVSRERVIEVAAQLFLQHGYAGTSLKDVSKELGVSAPAIYWYFPSKEDLYVEVIETSMLEFINSVYTSVTADSPLEQLIQYVRAHVTWQLDKSDAARTFDLAHRVKDIPAERLAVVREYQVGYRDRIRKVLCDGCDQGVFYIDQINVTAASIITLCEYVHTWFNPAGKLTVSEVAEMLVVLVRNMVCTPPSKQ